MGKGALGQLAAYWPEDTPRHAHVPLKRATEIALFAPASTHGDRPALATASGRITFADLASRVKDVAARLRVRAEKNARVAIALADPAELLTAMLGAWENEMLVYASAAPATRAALDAFQPDLAIGEAGEGSISFTDLLGGEANEKAEKPDYKKPLLALAKPGGAGEVGHTHKTLGATAIATANFLMIDAGASVALLEAPTHWLTLAAMLGTWQKGGLLIAAYGAHAAPLPERVDYAVASWPVGEQRILGDAGLGCRVGAGALLGIETAFSVSRRRRLSRRLRAPILTVFGRNDLGPVLASHPTWFLDDAAGIP
ncbi:MAG: AMP-binding protein, partial [Candidatus Binatia bacterium]